MLDLFSVVFKVQLFAKIHGHLQSIIDDKNGGK